jgi:hypothetical protein
VPSKYPLDRLLDGSAQKVLFFIINIIIKGILGGFVD